MPSKTASDLSGFRAMPFAQNQNNMQGVNTACEVIEIGHVVGWGQRNKQLGVIGVLLLINTVKVGDACDGRDV